MSTEQNTSKQTPKLFVMRIFGLGCPQQGAETTAYIHDNLLVIGNSSGFRPVALTALKTYQQGHEFIVEWKQLNEGYTATMGLSPSLEDVNYGWTPESWFELLDTLRDPEQHANDESSNKLITTAIFTTIGVASALVIIFFLAFQHISHKVVEYISIEKEEQIGAQLWEQVKGQLKIVENTEANQTAAYVLKHLLAAQPSQYHYQIFINDSPEIKIYGLPGGYLVVNRGLLEQCQNTEEFAGIVAHEIAHIQARHTLYDLVERQGSRLAWDLISGSLESALIKTGVQQFKQIKYSTEHDTEADALAYQRLVLAKIDSNQLVYLFERLTRGTFENTPDLLIDHPYNDQRHPKLEHNTMKWETLPIDWFATVGSLSAPASIINNTANELAPGELMPGKKTLDRTD